YHEEAARLIPDPFEKADRYRTAGKLQKDVSTLLNDQTEREQKVEAFQQSALAYGEAARLMPDPTQKFIPYIAAAKAQHSAHKLLNDQTERGKKIEALQQSALYYSAAASWISDPAKKVEAYRCAGTLQFGLHKLLNDQTERGKKIEALQR